MEENDKDYFMYILEAMAYISATFAALIYMWETCLKERKKKRKPIDLEAGIIEESGDEESPLSISSPFRRRVFSNGS